MLHYISDFHLPATLPLDHAQHVPTLKLLGLPRHGIQPVAISNISKHQQCMLYPSLLHTKSLTVIMAPNPDHARHGKSLPRLRNSAHILLL